MISELNVPVMLFPLKLAVEDEYVEEKRGGREDEEQGGGVGEAALGDGVEDGQEGEDEGGQEQGKQDAQEEARLGAYSPYQGYLILGGNIYMTFMSNKAFI